ncbi:MAG: glycosyltransferase [Solirubrobacterales bacterium]|nr:glycosyltransferase [Solirubrobacterales bacterium]
METATAGPGIQSRDHGGSYEKTTDAGRPPAEDALRRLGSGGAGLVLVCEDASAIGGTERVRDAILARFPAARSYLLDVRQPGAPPAEQQGFTKVRSRGTKSHFLGPIYAQRMSRVRVEGAAVLLSLCSHGWSLAPRLSAGTRHVAYVCGAAPSLFPPRSDDYVQANPRFLRPLIRAARPALRAHNRRLMRRPDLIVANSVWAAAEIERHVGRSAQVLPPSVRTDFFTPGTEPRSGLLLVSRLVAQKRIDIAVEAARRAGERLVIVGSGPRLEELRALARPGELEVVGQVDDEELRRRYRSARALISPNVEEFGLVMAEAQSCGTPVIAPAEGGALEIVGDPRTGVLVEREWTAASFAEGIGSVLGREPEPELARASAERFSEQRFIAGLERILAGELAHPGG